MMSVDFPSVGVVEVSHTLLGTGSLGCVYLGQGPCGTAYAVKMLNPYANLPQILLEEICEREIALHSSITQNRNVLPFLDAALSLDGHILLLELHDGDTLGNELLRSGHGFGWAKAIQFGVQLCNAATHIHNCHVAHLDINPGNILIDPDHSIVRLFDFNASRSLNGSHWDVDELILANPLFAAPETRLNKGSERSDIYSIAATVFAVATNAAPTLFVQPEMLSEWRVWSDDVGHENRGYAPAIDKSCPVANNALTVIERAMKPDPADRFETAEELKSALQAIETAI